MKDALVLGSKYGIGRLELTEVRGVTDGHWAFIRHAKYIEHLKIYRVQFISTRVLKDPLSMHTEILEG